MIIEPRFWADTEKGRSIMKIRKIISAAVSVCFSAVMLSGCGGGGSIPENQVFSIDDLNGKTIGVQLGTVGDTYASDIENATVERYNKGADAVQALKQGKVDAVLIDVEPAKVFVSNNSDLSILDESFAEEGYAIAVKKGNTELLEKINGHLALFEYGKAVQLLEENEQLCADPSFDSAKNEILVHYTETAKSYYSGAATFFTRQETQGNDVEAMFDSHGNFPASNLSNLLTEDEKTVIDRVNIARSTSGDYHDITVTIPVFGEQAAYPAQDIILSPVTAVTGEYTDSETLLKDVRFNMGIYRFGRAAELMEQNPGIASDPAFDGIKKDMLEYFTGEAKLYYTAASTHTVKQEVMGYGLTDGCEGYDTASHTLDPAVLTYILSSEQTALINRVKIVCLNEETYDFKVTVDIIGMTASYPANDVVL